MHISHSSRQHEMDHRALSLLVTAHDIRHVLDTIVAVDRKTYRKEIIFKALIEFKIAQLTPLLVDLGQPS